MIHWIIILSCMTPNANIANNFYRKNIIYALKNTGLQQ